ncbi:Cytochrome c-type biogenesis protein CcmF [Paraburkholderia ultramafica]|uniref:Cytochrome c-type biogenesis protein CcmF n=1 Tax=Paraburkholderia ultramafica TaxID=1544867 RepID=A0A6S7CXW7_9BURK|nr:heme lyase CcmF/NrfE family subunit [Paraburkholderia ultramafica]CAB3800583.1 Cytochrome c-type biogenesis protein CcmF [Paraburkholderia ultramafica]
MIPELGQVALLLALAVALVQGTLPLAGAACGRANWMSLARSAAQTHFMLVGVAFLCLVSSFVRNDFSVLYVATNSNSALPLPYRIAATWGGHEGSLLLWVVMLSTWMLAVAQFSRHLPQPLIARILSVMGLVSAGFLLFMLITSNPFERLSPVPPDGNDLNPLLQDPGMVGHPPMLYMGYVGFSVAFSFAVAALLGGNLDATWARWTRPWTTAAWTFLTIGIMLGSMWAYYVLGWGGWWFWDPVENASFMPWLAGTALIHSLAVTEKRGAFKSWTVLLAIVAFALSLVGTFLVRSGVLSSVHAFATDPRRGLFVLALLTVVIGGSLALYAWRAPKVGLGARFDLLSRETMLLANNVLFVVAMLSVLLGTLYPLLIDSLGMGKISVGPPYFDTVFVPLMVPVVFLLGIGPLARWRHAEAPELARRLRWAAAVAIVTTLVTEWLAGRITLGATLGFLMSFWIVASIVTDLWERVRPAGMHAGLLNRMQLLPRAMLGMMVAHLGVAAFAFGVSMVKTYQVERDVKMDVGDTTEVAGYVFTFRGLKTMQGPNYDAVQGLVEVTRGSRPVVVLRPEKRVYWVQRTPMTEAAIDPGPTRDLYVSLGEPVAGGAWIVRIYCKPFVDWIWGGCLLMALGGVLAASDRRYRSRKEQPAASTAGAPT